MVLTSGERVKRWRERQKAERDAVALKAKAKLDADFGDGFGQFFEDHGEKTSFGEVLSLAGFEEPSFSDDQGPEVFALNDVFVPDHDDPNEPRSPGSLGRAELMVACFTDAAQSLAKIINDYKKKEIEARIAEVEASDLSDAATRKAAMAEIVRLNKVLDQLEKQVRYTLPQWKIKGV